MPRNCCCSGGRCGEPIPTSELSRRQFIGVAGSVAATALASELAWADPAVELVAPLAAPKKPTAWNHPLTPARVYEGKHLEAVSMPIGGIGTGTIWLDGQGRLGTWQIYNNLTETRTPDSFFGVRARAAGGPAVTRVLQTVAEGDFKRVESLRYEGGYPIARLAFHDPELPVQVSLEAFNPMIPLDTANSSIPCAIFRLTARNPGKSDAEVTLFGSLQNAVGSGGAEKIKDVHFAGYGGNQNRCVREKNLTSLAMSKSPDPVAGGSVKVRAKDGREVAGTEMLWLTHARDLTLPIAQTLARIARDGGVVLVDGPGPDFFKTLAAMRDPQQKAALATVFEDFEKSDYKNWTITGKAFGKGPSHGAHPGQQEVQGFAGHGFVNTFVAGDGPQGLATSKTFRIEKRYIGFLIGGGHHPKTTCINLRVDGRVVRTTTGKNNENLEPASWDVADLKGKQAVIEIVDKESRAWGHINIDQIVFSDIHPEAFLGVHSPVGEVAKALGLSFSTVEKAALAADHRLVADKQFHSTLMPAVAPVAGAWKVTKFVRLLGLDLKKDYRVLVRTSGGDPLVIEGPLGKGRIVLSLAPGLPWDAGSALLVALRGQPLKPGEQIVPGWQEWGTMALTTMEAQASALLGWTKSGGLAAWLAGPLGSASGKADDVTLSPPGQTINGALAVPFVLKPGEERTVTFVITWHFPNVQQSRHWRFLAPEGYEYSGNLYSRRWPDALGVARYVAENIGPLAERTRLYHETVYQSNLPEEFLDAMTSQSVIFRGPTCFWDENGYFGGYEGCYACCPLNCTHVWNYAQSHARLFPEVGRNMRISNFITYLHPDGETSHREYGPNIKAWIDGHCACIVAALREYQLSTDRGFLEKIWPGVKKSVDWLIGKIDKDRDGLPAGEQFNTYDTAVSGANTFIGSQYLAALAAGERLAAVMNDTESAARWHAVREAGMKNQNEKLWNGEYYIQLPDPKPARDYNNGCHADQLLGQWWAHMIDLGYLYPRDRVRGALEAVMRHNFKEKFQGIKQDPRRYVPDDEGGLLICTWPHDDRPKSFILYADEVWTGIEYAAAGAMMYEGLVDQARQIVRMARSRYDGRRRDNLNSGPGGNPYNELECGKFYARAMSSWSLLIASQGLILEGPKGVLGFKPRWQPADHRSFYTAPEGWGLFIQRREANKQTEQIEVRHGQLRLKELVFELPADAKNTTATVTVAGKPATVALKQDGSEIRLTLAAEAVVAEGETVEIILNW